MTPLSLEYTACVIDCEGSIGVYYFGGSKWESRVVVANTYLPLIQQLKAQFGGRIQSAKKYARRKQCYNWHLTQEQAARFLKPLLPYLREKKEQAEILLEFQRVKDKHKNKGRKKYLTEEERVYRLELVERAKVLKHG